PMAARLPGAFGDEIFAGEVANLAVELDLVAGNRSGVYDANRHILKGQLLPVHFKIVSIVLHADLGIDGGGPLAGHAGGERRGAHGRQDELCASCESAAGDAASWHRIIQAAS